MSKYDLEAIRRRICSGRPDRPGERAKHHASMTRDLTRVTEVVAWAVYDALHGYHDHVTFRTAEHDRMAAIEDYGFKGDHHDADSFDEDFIDEDRYGNRGIAVPEYEDPWLRCDYQPRPDSRRGVRLCFNFDPDVLRLFTYRLDERGQKGEQVRHEFDYADPRCFEKLAAILAGFDVTLDPEALA